MTRSRASLAIAGGLLVSAGLWGCERAGWFLPLRAPRNVLLITVDTLRVDRLGSYGSTRGLTPHLDALAAEGIRFANTYAPTPLTAPSHSSMLTGRYPITHGLRNNGSEVLSGEELLLPEILKERGFRTAAVVSSLVLSSDFGLDQGFDLYYEEGIRGSERGRGLWFNQRPADETIERATKWLRAESDRPFFLWVHLFDPHDPYDPPSPYKEKYPEQPYDGEIAFADAQIGRLLDEVRALGHYEDSLVIMAGDHGEGLGDHGEVYHSLFIYNSTLHVPLIIRLPGARGAGRVVTDLSSVLDIAPTVLEALRIPLPEGIEGVSLLEAAARGGRVPARSLFLESIYPATSFGWAVARALVQSSWKLIDLPTPELYHLGSDANERANLHETDAAKAVELREELAGLVRDLEAGARQTEAAAIDDETRDRLISLGYIGGQQSISSLSRGADPKEMITLVEPLRTASGMLEKRRFAEAEKIFSDALATDPDNRMALMQIGRAYAAQGKLEESVRAYEHALKLYPDVEEFYRTYGWVLLRARRFQEAQEVFLRALLRLPEAAHMHFMLGYTRFHMQDWKGAEEELDLAVRLSAKSGRAHYLLAVCRLQAGDQAAALEHLEEYLKREPDVDSLFNDPYLQELRLRPEFQELVKRYL